MRRTISIASLLLTMLMPAAIRADTGSELPGITLTEVPPCGIELDVQGQTSNVVAADHAVAIYIWGGSWWTKPTFAQPTLPIAPDGSWGGDIWSHPNDLGADRITAFLVPATYDPPQSAGTPMLAAELFGFPHTEVVRPCATRHIDFSGSIWRVKDSGDQQVGPGPNYFSDDMENVSLDANGHLHLKITNREGVWQSAEVIHGSPDPGELGYGTYVFQVRGRIDLMDPFVVLGLFTWDSFAPDFNFREIDVEITRWGNASDPTNAQYVVQPYSTGGNLRRFAVDANGEITTTHTFHWRADGIEFRSWYGDASDPPTVETLIDEWTYAGPDTPPEDGENARVNLWLMSGLPPSDAQEYELVLEKFEFRASDAPGRVPDGEKIPGTPLTIGKNVAAPGDLDLAWGASCSPAGDYAIYEGEIGSWSSHSPSTCTTDGATSRSITPSTGDRFFLVVPLSDTTEGGYGDGADGPRPPSSMPCRPLLQLDPCQ